MVEADCASFSLAGEVIVPSALFFAVLFVFDGQAGPEPVAMMAGGLRPAPIFLASPSYCRGPGRPTLLGASTIEPATFWKTCPAPDVSTMRGSVLCLGPQLVVTASGVNAGRTLQDVFARQQEGKSS